MNQNLNKQNNILFVSHKKKKCGVYEFGKNIARTIQKSTKYNFIYIECSSLKELQNNIKTYNPKIIIYNYHPSTMPWLTTKCLAKIIKSKISNIKSIQIGIIHEITQELSDTAINYRNKFLLSRNTSNSIFDYYIAADPTLLLKNPIVFKTGRLIQNYKSLEPLPKKITVGSFGFATPKKGFEKIIKLVQDEFDEAIIRINIPSADFGDPQGKYAKEIEKNCKNLIKKKNIKLDITHNFLEGEKILDFLSQNTINVFLYENTEARGISSTIEYAMAVDRPIAISQDQMFRHILDIKPSICIKNNSLKQIIKNGVEVLKKRKEEWSEENMIWEYERIISTILQKNNNYKIKKISIKEKIKRKIKRLLSIPIIDQTWIEDSNSVNIQEYNTKINKKYSPILLPNNFSFNRILGNEARKIYKPALQALWELSPETMKKKISKANIQQAFVFDTVIRFISKYNNPKILCIGSYEDTASISLKKLGYQVEEIDPMINYSIQEYATKPNIKLESYNLIFSTSVIEHDPNDESFIKSMEKLLAPNGLFIMTCDFKKDWSFGDSKPDVDERLYTKNDLNNRLLSYTKNCKLIDKPNWDYINEDFIFLNKYKYSFASFVITKTK